MKDYLVRAISSEANVRGLACITTVLVDRARVLHGTLPTASAALGRALTGGALMGALLKRDQRVGIKIEGTGPLKKIIVEADSTGAVRGFVKVPGIDLPPRGGKLDVAGAVGGEGFLTVIRDEGLNEPYQGIVRLRTGEIAEDLAWYFADSEQIPSAVGLGIFVEPGGQVSAAGGFLFQALPPSDDSMIDALIDRLSNLSPVTSLIREGNTPEDILSVVFGDIPFHELEKRELLYRCFCNREKIEKVLISLGLDELKALRMEEGSADVTCEFCRSVYHFSESNLDALLEEM